MGAKPAPDRERQDPSWYAIWTRANCEQRVTDQLRDSGYTVFLPTATVWSRRGRARKRVSAPLFPGYLFVHRALDRRAHAEILRARGVVRVLGDGVDRLTPVPDDEVMRLRRLAEAALPVFPYVGFHEGDRVRIVEGPLAGLTGAFVRGRPGKGLLVVSVTLLRRSVAVEVDCADVERA